MKNGSSIGSMVILMISKSAEVLQFLEEHPDLKEELSEIELFRLKPTEDQYYRIKPALKNQLMIFQKPSLSICVRQVLRMIFLPNSRRELEQITSKQPRKKEDF